MNKDLYMKKTNTTTTTTTRYKYYHQSKKMRFLNMNIKDFSPFWFITLMATGISASILHSFPYEGQWLRDCSYIMFALACLIFILLQVILVIHSKYMIDNYGFKKFFQYYFLDVKNNLFWGTYCMGFATIINYVFLIASSLPDNQKNATNIRNMIIAVYVLWWYDMAISLICAWGVTFCIWRYHKAEKTIKMSQNLHSLLILPIITLVVASSTSGLFGMSEIFVKHFSRNIQLLTIIVTMCIWLHAIALVFLVFGVYVWNLYVNRLPEASKIFTFFICIGPCGQGAFGIQLLTDNISKYILKYYDSENYYVISVSSSFRVAGVMLALMLLSLGFFFTVLGFVAIASYHRYNILKFNKGWLAMTFPLGTMSLGTKEIYDQYGRYVSLEAFRVVSAFYSVATVFITLYCVFQLLKEYCKNFQRHSSKSSIF